MRNASLPVAQHVAGVDIRKDGEGLPYLESMGR